MNLLSLLGKVGSITWMYYADRMNELPLYVIHISEHTRPVSIW